MASSINAITTGSGGVVTTADNSGDLNIQSGGSTKIAVTSTGAAVTGTLSASGTGQVGTTLGVGNDALLNPVTATPADVTAILVEPPLCMFKSPLLSAVVITPPEPVVRAFIELAIMYSSLYNYPCDVPSFH